jgi:hypothetical protein
MAAQHVSRLRFDERLAIKNPVAVEKPAANLH